MNSRIRKLAESKFRSSNSKLLNRVANSLERDREVPMGYLLKKSMIFLVSLITAKFNLRKCTSIGKGLRTRKKPHIENLGRIELGNRVNINSRNVQTDLVTGPNGILRIDKETSINFGVSIVANKEINIGKRVRIGPYTMIYDSNLHVHGKRFERAKGNPVNIEDDVWLASRVMVLQGSRVGKGSLVASGSIVSGIIPPYVIAAGVPAKVIKYLKPRDSNFTWERGMRDSKATSCVIVDRVCSVFADLLDTDKEKIKEDYHNIKLSNLDSFQFVKFIKELEREFDFEVRKDEWSKIKTLNKASLLVKKHFDWEEHQMSLPKGRYQAI
ncbi:MAG: hypothetical protein JJ892_07350 [Balneola sp.]|nr:hypothetical protein [Balneola sp.]MBO6650947.1 hypothetical protein [Balneola sp.]MBO6711889.1 hypothetical protein [Balneola sp.]MBO6800084.1 hypothetical protein [Balneola sp.]MBO6871535.1 hypothetical protein [Balneola sp.]